MFMTSLEDPTRVIARPDGHFLAPYESERVNDVSSVVFANGWVVLPDHTVLIYYAGSDTRCYVARSSVDRLVDWCLHTPEDGLTTRRCLEQRQALIQASLAFIR
jgi:4-O-beta-D-mannosyl-D-glucose phosphorylase